VVEDQTFKNLIVDNDANLNLLHYFSFFPTSFSVKNIIFEDSILLKIRSLLFLDNPGGSITVDTVSFTNVTVGDSISFFKLSQAQTLTLNSLYYES